MKDENKFSIGDTVVYDVDYMPGEQVGIVTEIENGVISVKYGKSGGLGMYHLSGAGYLAKPTDEPMIRKLTKLEKALK